jgi:hypothetical protein
MGIQDDTQSQIDVIVARDPLYPLSSNDKKLLWAERDYCKTRAKVPNLPYHPSNNNSNNNSSFSLFFLFSVLAQVLKLCGL